MELSQLLPVLGLALIATTGQCSLYEGYQVFNVTPQQEEDLSKLYALQYKEMLGDGLDFWTEATRVGEQAHIMVPKQQISKFKYFLAEARLQADVLIENVQETIDEATIHADPAGSDEFGWTKYQTLSKINKWLESLEEQYPDLVSVVKGGSTYEKRDIIGVRVDFGKTENAKAVFIDGGIHAREWVSPATVTYILNAILTSTDPEVRTLAERYTWYIFPVINPDGYTYTFGGDRLWRKSRAPNSGRPSCPGVDLNRNWNFRWMQGGASGEPCSDAYAGRAPFSAIETKTLSEYISTIPNLDSYISFHSYSQLILYPYGSGEVADNAKELDRLAGLAAAKLSERYGTHYRYGRIDETIYVATGSSLDWVKKDLGIRLSYAYELRDTGAYGFLLPPKLIIPTSEETLDSLTALLQ